MQDIRLYIGEMEVEFKDTPEILYNWTETDLSNPTLTKNGYSKTITVEGTPNNNKIFGHFWNLERYQYGVSNNGPGFNPSYRVPFTLYHNGSVFESGYVKLQNIKMEGGVVSYEIGLFGGLGSFLYNLSVDWNTGDKKTLANLKYIDEWSNGEYFYESPHNEVDLGFTINKEAVKEAWDGLLSPDGRKWTQINFAPCYNGLNEQMTNDKAVINFNNMPANPFTATTSNSGTYTTSNGYALATLPEELTEWQTKDLRCWAQRPVIRAEAIIQALRYRENNKGKYDEGYKVILDPDFFEYHNPYYEKSWMTLPLLSSLEFNNKDESSETYTANWSSVSKEGDTSYTYTFTLPSTVTEYGVSVKLAFDIYLNVPGVNVGELHPSFWGLAQGTTLVVENALGVQAFAQDGVNGGGNIIASSDIAWLGYERLNGQQWYVSIPSYKECVKKGVYTPLVENPQVSVIKGHYVRVSSGVYRWNSQIVLKCDLPIGSKSFSINLQRAGLVNRKKGSVYYRTAVAARYAVPLPTGVLQSSFDTVNKTALSNREFVIHIPSQNNFYTNREITKEQLLTTEYTPADWLIAFCKMFGLYMHKDLQEDKIYLDTRNTFYRRNNITDISGFIDYSRELTITPIVVNAGYYSMKNESVESGVFKDYLEKYGKEYGMKIINTGYELDAETKELISMPFKNAVQTLGNSVYYFKPLNGVQPFCYDNLKYNLYKNGDVESGTTEMSIATKDIAQVFTPLDSTNPYLDLFDKVSLCGEDNSPEDGENVFLFYVYDKDCSGNGYYLSDDVDAMARLNNGPCHLITNSTADTSGVNIAIALNEIPRFSRYFAPGGKKIMFSFDWGMPRQLYVPSLYYYEDTTLYGHFYAKYLEDLYDINTKQVTCYVKPNRILMEDDLRNFYWFRNGIWRLNRVIDYNPTSNDLVKCEFIKVQDLADMTNVTPDVNTRIVEINPETLNVPASGGTFSITVITNDGDGFDIEDYSEGLSFSGLDRPGGKNEDGEFQVIVPLNTATTSVEYYIRYTAGDGGGGETRILQEASSYTPSISVSPGSIPFTSDASASNITVSSNQSWTVNNPNSWISLSKNSGTGNDTVRLSVPVNEGNARYGVVTFNGAVSGSASVNVYQANGETPVWNECHIHFTYGNVTAPQTGTWDQYTIFYSYNESEPPVEWGDPMVEFQCGTIIYQGGTWNPVNTSSWNIWLPFEVYEPYDQIYVPSEMAGQTIYLQAEFASGEVGQAITSAIVPVFIPLTGGTINVTMPQF